MLAFFRWQFVELVMAERTAFVERNTLETQVKVSINLDGTGKARFDIGVPFLEHMLDQIARHGLIDLDIECKGDLHIDDHHTVDRHHSRPGFRQGRRRQEGHDPLRPFLRAAG